MKRLPAQSLRDLNRAKTDRAEAELNDLKGAAGELDGKLALLLQAFKELNNARTDKAVAELKSLGKAADLAQDKLDRLRAQSTTSPTGRQNTQQRTRPGTNRPGTFGGPFVSNGNPGRFGEAVYERTPIGTYVPITGGTAVAAGAGVAAGVIASAHAFKSYASADRRMTLLGMNADATDDEIADATKRVRKLAFDLAIPVEQAVSGLEDIIASGVETLEKGMEMLPATLKASMGSGTPTGLMATALKSSVDKMGLTAEQLPQASDTIITGGRMGKFEVEDMARYLPTLLPIASQQLKYTGVEGLQKVAADLQIVRDTAGSSGDAFTRVKDFYLKIFQTATQKNFKDAGYDLEGTVNNAIKTGGDPVEAAIALTQKAVNKRPDILPKLFTDQESLLAAQAFLANPNGRSHYMGGMAKASGTTEESYQRVSQDAQASLDRLGNAASNAAYGIGKLLDKAGVPSVLNAIGGASEQVSEDGLWAFPKAMGRVYNEYWTKPATNWFNDTFGLDGEQKSPYPEPVKQADPVGALRDYMKDPQGYKSSPIEELPRNVPRPKPDHVPGQQSSLQIDAAQHAANTRIDIDPDLGDVAARLAPAGTEAGARFAAALKSEAERAGAVADQLQARFSFVATPTISPNFSAVPSAAPGPASGPARRSTAGASPTIVNQRINGKTDPMQTARAVTREQNRAIRQARARALHDLGPFA